MRTYIIRRLLAMIPMFFIMTGAFFALMNMLPGGPVQEALAVLRGVGGETSSGKEFSPEDLEKVRKELERQYNLDKPALVRYVMWLGQMARGDFGLSTVDRRPAFERIVERLKVSLTFGIPGFFLTYLVCIPLGVAKALRDGSRFDVVSSLVLFFIYAVPQLIWGLIFLLVFCSGRIPLIGDLFPLGGLYSDNYNELSSFGKFLDFLWHMFLPVTAYMMSHFTFLTLLQKNSLLDVIRSDYIRTARAKGLAENVVIFKHALRNAILPLMVNIGYVLAAVVSSSIIIEQLFDIPGMGRLFLDSMNSRDYNTLMGIVVINVVVVMGAKLLSDMAYVLVDPRIDFK